jgi:hypothetical protein
MTSQKRGFYNDGRDLDVVSLWLCTIPVIGSSSSAGLYLSKVV